MKIAYIAKKYNVFGKPESGLSYMHCNFYDTLTKMKNGQNEIVYFPFDEITQKEGKEKMNNLLLEKIKETKPDLVFFIINLTDTTVLKIETIKELTRIASTLNFFTDDYWQFEKVSKYIAPYFSWIATPDPKAPEKYHKIGYHNVVEFQYACNHFLYEPLDLKKIYDVSFIGYPHGNRKEVVKKIESAGFKVNCWGSGWPNGRASQQEIIKIFSQSKINLNFAKNSGIFWKEFASLFFRRNYDRSLRFNSPKYLLSNLKSARLSMWQRAIKGRIFEIMGCAGFLITEYSNGLERYYRIDKEIVCYKTIPELIEKIRYFLDHDGEREIIARAGYERTIRDHTFERRFDNLFQKIGLTN